MVFIPGIPVGGSGAVPPQALPQGQYLNPD
jgi:hypothetical protein